MFESNVSDSSFTRLNSGIFTFRFWFFQETYHVTSNIDHIHFQCNVECVFPCPLGHFQPLFHHVWNIDFRIVVFLVPTFQFVVVNSETFPNDLPFRRFFTKKFRYVVFNWCHWPYFCKIVMSDCYGTKWNMNLVKLSVCLYLRFGTFLEGWSRAIDLATSLWFSLIKAMTKLRQLAFPSCNHLLAHSTKTHWPPTLFCSASWISMTEKSKCNITWSKFLLISLNFLMTLNNTVFPSWEWS